MVIGTKLKKITILLKKKSLQLTQIVLDSNFLKEKNQLIFSPIKQNAKTHKNNNNQTNLTQYPYHTTHVDNTELGLGLGFVFMLCFCFKVRLLF